MEKRGLGLISQRGATPPAQFALARNVGAGVTLTATHSAPGFLPRYHWLHRQRNPGTETQPWVLCPRLPCSSSLRNAPSGWQVQSTAHRSRPGSSTS